MSSLRCQNKDCNHSKFQHTDNEPEGRTDCMVLGCDCDQFVPGVDPPPDPEPPKTMEAVTPQPQVGSADINLAKMPWNQRIMMLLAAHLLHMSGSKRNKPYRLHAAVLKAAGELQVSVKAEENGDFLLWAEKSDPEKVH